MTIIDVVKQLLLPPLSLLFPAFIGLIFGRQRFGLPLSTVSLLVLLLLTLPCVVGEWSRLWERFPPLQSGRIQQFRPQALVVIGGGVVKRADEYDASFTVNTGTLVRLRYAAKLAREFDLPVLVSGGRSGDTGRISEAELMARVLEQDFKIPVAWQERQSRNTAENARFSYELLKGYGIYDIVLVTQAYHMPRAMSEFNKTGFKVLPAPTGFIGANSGLTVVDCLPSPTALKNAFLLVYESLGMLWYSIRY